MVLCILYSKATGVLEDSWQTPEYYQNRPMFKNMNYYYFFLISFFSDKFYISVIKILSTDIVFDILTKNYFVKLLNYMCECILGCYINK